LLRCATISSTVARGISSVPLIYVPSSIFNIHKFMRSAKNCKRKMHQSIKKD